jgi:hypothetical protein
VNTLDEFGLQLVHERIGVREMSTSELVRGPNRTVRFGTAWTVVRGRIAAFHPAFAPSIAPIRRRPYRSRSIRRPIEMQTGAEVVGTAFYPPRLQHRRDASGGGRSATLEIALKA